MLRLEHGSVWSWNLDAPGNRKERPEKFWNVVLEKDGEDLLDRSCEKWRSVSDQRYTIHEIRKRKANWIAHILRRNCLLQHVIERKIKGQIEVTRRRCRRRKKLLDDLKDRRWYCQLKEEALDCTMWRNRFGRGFGPVVWLITDDDDDDDDDDVHDKIIKCRTVFFRVNRLGVIKAVYQHWDQNPGEITKSTSGIITCCARN